MPEICNQPSSYTLMTYHSNWSRKSDLYAEDKLFHLKVISCLIRCILSLQVCDYSPLLLRGVFLGAACTEMKVQ